MSVPLALSSRWIVLIALLGLLAPRQALAIEFRPANDPKPVSSLGGGVRGQVQFAPVGGTSSTSNLGGGIRGNVQFSANNTSNAPHSSGGGVRGAVQFVSPKDSGSLGSSAGGVRGQYDSSFLLPGLDPSFESASGQSLPQNSSRTATSTESLGLTALLPGTQVVGRTLADHPTFFAYVPPNAVGKLFFSLQDDRGRQQYQETVSVPESGGVVAITLPPTVPGLALDRTYVWFLAAPDANDRLSPDSASTVGWVKRVASDAVMAQGHTLSDLDRAVLYAKSGIWYDTLALLANGKDRSILQSEWADLLTQVGVGALGSEPIYTIQ